MADNNNQGLFNIPSLTQQQVDPIAQMAREFSQKDAYYRQVLGDQIIDQGLGAYGPQFFTLLEQQLSTNPNVSLAVQGKSGQFMPTQQTNLQAMNSPAMLNARLGVEQNGLRGGLNTVLVQMPDGSIKQMPRMYDVGYNTDVLGGNLDVGAGYVPKEGQMPKSMYNIQARYKKSF